MTCSELKMLEHSTYLTNFTYKNQSIVEHTVVQMQLPCTASSAELKQGLKKR